MGRWGSCEHRGRRRSFTSRLVLVVKDTFLVAPWAQPDLLRKTRCSFCSGHTPLQARVPQEEKARCCLSPWLGRCQCPDVFSVQIQQASRISHLCCGLCGAGKESGLFHVSIAMTGMRDFNTLPLGCHQRKGRGPASEASPEGRVPRAGSQPPQLQGPEGRKLTQSPGSLSPAHSE